MFTFVMDVIIVVFPLQLPKLLMMLMSELKSLLYLL